MARQRRPRAAPNDESLAEHTYTVDDELTDDRPSELKAADLRAQTALCRVLEGPRDPDARRELEAAKAERDRLGGEWIAKITLAFARSHGGRSVVALETFTPAAAATVQKHKPLLGEAPPSRMRRSQRSTPLRDEREATARKIKIDPEIEHARIVDAQRVRLTDLRASWGRIVAFRQKIAELGELAPLVTVVDKTTRAEATMHVDALCTWVERVAPSYCRSAEDLWLPFASEDLDDDEIALILSPAGHRRDRARALRAVRERRHKLEARAKKAAGGSPSELERRRRRLASRARQIRGRGPYRPSLASPKEARSR